MNEKDEILRLRKLLELEESKILFLEGQIKQLQKHMQVSLEDLKKASAANELRLKQQHQSELDEFQEKEKEGEDRRAKLKLKSSQLSRDLKETQKRLQSEEEKAADFKRQFTQLTIEFEQARQAATMKAEKLTEQLKSDACKYQEEKEQWEKIIADLEGKSIRAEQLRIKMTAEKEKLENEFRKLKESFSVTNNQILIAQEDLASHKAMLKKLKTESEEEIQALRLEVSQLKGKVEEDNLLREAKEALEASSAHLYSVQMDLKAQIEKKQLEYQKGYQDLESQIKKLKHESTKESALRLKSEQYIETIERSLEGLQSEKESLSKQLLELKAATLEKESALKSDHEGRELELSEKLTRSSEKLTQYSEKLTQYQEEKRGWEELFTKSEFGRVELERDFQKAQSQFEEDRKIHERECHLKNSKLTEATTQIELLNSQLQSEVSHRQQIESQKVAAEVEIKRLKKLYPLRDLLKIKEAQIEEVKKELEAMSGDQRRDSERKDLSGILGAMTHQAEKLRKITEEIRHETQLETQLEVHLETRVETQGGSQPILYQSPLAPPPPEDPPPPEKRSPPPAAIFLSVTSSGSRSPKSSV